jgi:toxin FitB
VSYLIDTNVVSEAVRPRPAAPVLRWLRSVPDSALHISVLTVGELRSGIEQLGEGARKERLRVWLEQELPAWFGDRLLPITPAVADRWGRLVGETSRPVAAIDCLLAATAIAHDLRLVTRNADDFAFQGLEVINPWQVGAR